MKIKRNDGSIEEITVKEFGSRVDSNTFEILTITEISEEESAALKEIYPDNFISSDEIEEVTNNFFSQVSRLID